MMFSAGRQSLGSLLQRQYTTDKRGGSSKKYMARQRRDPFVKQAVAENYRSRSSYKLVELLTKYPLLPSKQSQLCVVDCGAAPGGWSQVVARRLALGAGSERAVAVDLLPMQGVPGVRFIEGDFLAEATKQQMGQALGGRAVGLVLSDMAPSFTGHRSVDALRTMALCEDVVDFAEETLAGGGNMVLKFFMGGGEAELRTRLRGMFAKVKIDKPLASRKESAEQYLVCLGRKM
ncbi:2' O-ribose methyltransferase [Coemansia sp. RSA 552]|nr:2' O-ribose methyltransferase [Coemansia sp. RSA 552]